MQTKPPMEQQLHNASPSAQAQAQAKARAQAQAQARVQAQAQARLRAQQQAQQAHGQQQQQQQQQGHGQQQQQLPPGNAQRAPQQVQQPMHGQMNSQGSGGNTSGNAPPMHHQQAPPSQGMSGSSHQQQQFTSSGPMPVSQSQRVSVSSKPADGSSMNASTVYSMQQAQQRPHPGQQQPSGSRQPGQPSTQAGMHQGPSGGTPHIQGPPSDGNQQSKGKPGAHSQGLPVNSQHPQQMAPTSNGMMSMQPSSAGMSMQGAPAQSQMHHPNTMRSSPNMSSQMPAQSMPMQHIQSGQQPNQQMVNNQHGMQARGMTQSHGHPHHSGQMHQSQQPNSGGQQPHPNQGHPGMQGNYNHAMPPYGMQSHPQHKGPPQQGQSQVPPNAPYNGQQQQQPGHGNMMHHIPPGQQGRPQQTRMMPNQPMQNMGHPQSNHPQNAPQVGMQNHNRQMHPQMSRAPRDWHNKNDASQREAREQMYRQIVDLLKVRKHHPSAPSRPEWVRKLPEMARKLEESLYRSAAGFEEYKDKATLKSRLQKLAKEMNRRPGKSVPRQDGSNQDPNMRGRVQNPNNPNAQGYPQTQRSSSGDPQSQQKPSANAKERQQVLRQQQQRLLLLRHASKCTRPEGKCTSTPHCKAMRDLWKHIASCKKQKCERAHCVSSRYVLSHYHRCKDPRCAVCGPVREAIKKHQQQQQQSNRPQQQQRQPNIPQLPQQGGGYQQQHPNHMQHTGQHPMNRGAHPGHPGQHYQDRSGSMMGHHPQPPGYPQGHPHSQHPQQSRPHSNQPMGHRQPYPHQQQVSMGQYPQGSRPQGGRGRPAGGAGNRVPPPPPDHGSGHQMSHDTTGMKRQRQHEPVHQVTKKSRMDHMYHQSAAQYRNRISRSLQIENSNLINSFTPEMIRTHIQSLQTGFNPHQTPQEVKNIMQPILKQLQEHEYGWIFNEEVDPVKLNLPDYFDVIKKPMDLGTIKKKLDSLSYKLPEQFAVDVRLTFNNAILYNNAESDVHKLAKDMLRQFEKEYAKVLEDLENIEKSRREGDNACRLCGGECFLFEPPVLYCDGACGGQRIRRSAYYWTNSDQKFHLCTNCYNNSKDGEIYKKGDKSITKIDLTKKKNDERHEEPWVGCDGCGRWVHQVCALFNGRTNATQQQQQGKTAARDERLKQQVLENQNKRGGKPSKARANSKEARKGGKSAKSGKGSKAERNRASNGKVEDQKMIVEPVQAEKKEAKGPPYFCPACCLEARFRKDHSMRPTTKGLGAADLPQTNLSGYIEMRINARLQEIREREADEKNIPIEDVPTAEGVTIRMVSCADKDQPVRERMARRYEKLDYHKDGKYPTSFKYRSKCLLMFQKIEGVDICCYGMYVYEYDDKEPEPNNRRVYISYLDSVKYFRPSRFRTIVYQEILVAYLDHCKKRGFHTASIWACPPYKGDDYILYCHPEEQKTPKPERLRQWYYTFLDRCKELGIVREYVNMYDEFFKRKDSSAAKLPYFEGDYWTGIAEDKIKEIEEEKVKEAEKAKKSGKKKQPKAKKALKKGTRSSGAPASSVISNDELLVRLATVIEPMKDDFILAKMSDTCNGCNNAVIFGNAYFDERENKKGYFCLCQKCYTKEDAAEGKRSGNVDLPCKLEELKKRQITGWAETCDDPDLLEECDFFDTRQAFLSLCVGNHYQFDQLRRAKHSSMMVLYHLHNPTAPAFIHYCNMCNKEITSGVRWHCDTCPDFDICDECKRSMDADPTKKHPHPLKDIKVEADTQQNKDSEAARRQRNQHIQQHLELLVHSSACQNDNCKKPHCKKMKDLLAHNANCPHRAGGNSCSMCKRINALLHIHARSCRNNRDCPVRQCKALKEKLRQLSLQQQAMDDRRRQNVTKFYAQQNEQQPRGGGHAAASMHQQPYQKR